MLGWLLISSPPSSENRPHPPPPPPLLQHYMSSVPIYPCMYRIMKALSLKLWSLLSRTTQKFFKIYFGYVLAYKVLIKFLCLLCFSLVLIITKKLQSSRTRGMNFHSFCMTGGVTICEIIWTGGLPHLSGLPGLPWVSHLHVNRPLV